MNIIILGPQGSGKGTQADLLEHKFGLNHIETGKILRKIAESESPLANEIRDTMNSGKLVSDDILDEVLKEYMNKNVYSGFLFDGTPRNMDQYDLIKNILIKKGEKIDKVILVDISEEETIKRLSSRRTCKQCGKVYNILTNPPPNDLCECGGDLFQREDDTNEAIKKRLATYHKDTEKVLEQAEKDGLLLKFNGEQAIEKIHEEILEKLKI